MNERNIKLFDLSIIIFLIITMLLVARMSFAQESSTCASTSARHFPSEQFIVVVDPATIPTTSYQLELPAVRTSAGTCNKRLFYTSTAVFAAGTFLDCYSSRSGIELNPLFRDENSRFSMKKKLEFNLALYGVSLLMPKRIGNKFRMVIGLVYTGAGIYNFTR